MSKTVLFVCQRPPFPPNKGEKIRTYYQIKHLLDKGVNVCVACTIENEEALSDLSSLEGQLGVSILYAKQRPQLINLFLSVLLRRSISEQTFFSRQLRKKIHDFCQFNDVNAIVFTASSLIHYGDSLEVDRYMDFMDLDSDKWQQYAKATSGPMSWVYNRESQRIQQLEKYAVSTCIENYLISDNEVDLLMSTIKTTTKTVQKVGNGIAMDEFYPPNVRRQSAQTSPIFLFVGVMDYKPNEEAVIWFCENVFQTLKKNYPDAQFKIVGMSPSVRIHRLSRIEGVTVTGKVESVLPFFHEADLFVAPFHLARGVQNKVLQSFACGLPVVTTAMGVEGIEGDVEACARICAQPEEFVENISALISNDEIRHRMAKTAVELIQNEYSWSSKLNKFLQPMFEKD